LTASFVAITREVSPSIAQCELTHLARRPIDYRLAAAQHRRYEACLAELGCEVFRLAPEPELPDAVFVEDTAVVLDELAVITRPGAESRRPETRSVAEALRRHRRLGFIEAPGTMDGGDVLRVDRQLHVGRSTRTNSAGIEQLRALVAAHGYEVVEASVAGCLHVKSAVTQVAERTLLLNRALLAAGAFATFDIIDVDPQEPHGANAVLIDRAIVYPADSPRTLRRLEQCGLRAAVVDVSELRKAEGAVTCCSLIFRK
jgi:dimethylargininase